LCAGFLVAADPISLSHCAFFANRGVSCVAAEGALASGVATELSFVGNAASDGLVCLTASADIAESVFLRNAAGSFVRAPSVAFRRCVFDRAPAGARAVQCRITAGETLTPIEVKCFRGQGRLAAGGTPSASQSPTPTPLDDDDTPWGFVATIALLGISAVGLMFITFCDQRNAARELVSSDEEMLTPDP
jgi:hypothetical protein